MPTKATAVAQATPAPAKGTIEQFLKTRSNEELVKQGVAAMAVVAHATAELEAIKGELETRFDGEKTSEFLIYEHGVAERKVTNTWYVEGTRIEEVQSILGPARYAEYIDEKRIVKLPDERAEELEKMLGRKYANYFIETWKYGLTAAGRVAIRDDAKLARRLAKAVTVAQIVKVSIKPVEKK